MSHSTTSLEPGGPRHRHCLPDGAGPPIGSAADWTVPQRWSELTDGDHWVWDRLFERQKTLLHGKLVGAFEKGLEILDLSRPGIPDFDELNAKLGKRSGWTIVAVPGLIPDSIFFEHLANRRFPAGNFIRGASQIDYLEEPDVFHDIFGHAPLLAQPDVANFMAELGRLGLEALAIGEIERVARLYWYTVEFGLARENGETRIYGAGIASSFGETHYSLEGRRPRRLKFDLKRVMRTRYRTDDFQQCYFVLDRFEDLLKIVRDHDFAGLCAELEELPDLEPEASAPDELVAS